MVKGEKTVGSGPDLLKPGGNSPIADVDDNGKAMVDVI